MSTTSYIAGENVLCYHGPVIYHAKVLKTETWDETNTKLGSIGPHYFVHYKGWKQSWDEWVPPPRLLKLTDANLLIRAQVDADVVAKGKAAAKAETNKESSAGPAKSSTTTGKRKAADTGGTGRKRAAVGDGAAEEGNRKPVLKLDVPDALKLVLVDDWEKVTKNNQLVPLPREPHVQDILKEFAAHCEERSDKKLPSKEIVLPTMISGLQLYFERSLGTNLLYRFERGQYAEMRRRYVTGRDVIVGQEKSMSEVYGGEHLLRLIVKLPDMIAQTTLDPESVALLRDYIVELMAFMMADKTRFFLSEYENATSHYLALMRS